MVYTDKLYIKIFKGVTPTSFSRFGTLPVSVGWHTVGWSIDEAAGNGIYMVDGVTETFAVTYTTPSAAVSSYPLQIGAAGNAFTPLPNGTFIQSVAMWEGVALTAAQLVSLNMQHNDDYIWATEWLPYSTTDVTARALAFGIRLNGSVDGSSSPAVSVLGTSIDMPDRHLGFDNQNAGTSVGGYTILFSPPFKALKAISLANYSLDTSAGERYDIISSDANHVTIKFYKAPSTASTGAGLAKIFSLHAYGYGAVVQ
jgi:hypothetical protein